MNGGHDFDDMEGRPEVRRKNGGGVGGLGLVLLVGLMAAGVWGAWKFAGPDRASAAPGDRPVLLMFTADWCGPCQALKAGALSNPVVLDKMEKSCRLQIVDLTVWKGRSAETAKQYGVRAIPTLILVDTTGREISRYQGPNDAQYFARWLDQNAR
jgi:thiol:disulfide interchange protein